MIVSWLKMSVKADIFRVCVRKGVLRCEVSSSAAKSLSMVVAEPSVSLALASRDSVLYFGLAKYMGSGSLVAVSYTHLTLPTSDLV